MRAFLSHSSRDKGLVEEVVDHLGVGHVELDSITFEGGLLNVSAIQDSLKRCTIFVLFLTNDAITSGYVRFEALLAQELVAKGVIDRFLVVCIDQGAFSKAVDTWRQFNFVRHISTPQSIARLIQHQLLLVRAMRKSEHQPYVERSPEKDRLIEFLNEPTRPPVVAIYASGNVGIGRRTFAKRFYRDRYPSVNSVFAEVGVAAFDGYQELYRKLSQQLLPAFNLTNLRARITGFLVADDNEKAAQIARIIERLAESREALVLRDEGGLSGADGALQQPLLNIMQRMKPQPYPVLILVAARMTPRALRPKLSIAYCPLTSMTPAQMAQLAGFLLKDANIPYTIDDMKHIVELSDGHPFNVKFLIESATESTLPVVLADTGEFTQWKRNRGSEFLRQIEFSDTEKTVLAALKDFNVLDFETLHHISETDVAEVGRTLARLMDFHIVEGSGDTYQVSPPLRIALQRDPRLVLSATRRKATMMVVSDSLKTRGEADEISTSLIDAGILASLQAGMDVPTLFAAFLLPSHYVWLARRRYDDRQWVECIALSLKAIESVNNLSPAGRVEACRLLCLSATRSDRQSDFEKGIQLLRGRADDAWAKSNVSFLMGFRARLEGRLPDAEKFFREAHQQMAGNIHASRELASISLMLGDLDTAETFARRSLEVAPDNPYLLDILLGVLISGSRGKPRGQRPEIEWLFERLARAAQTDDRSFYAARRAEDEFRHGSLAEASRLIDDASQKTPGIFSVLALRAKIYLDRGIKSVVWEEIEKMRNMVYRVVGGERRSNLRPLLEIEATYALSNGDYESAKNIYRTKGVFTDEEAQREIKDVEFQQAMLQR